MAVKIRLTRIGRHKRPFYRIIATDSRMPRDGRHCDILGTYDPLVNPASVTLKREKVLKWLRDGAEVSQTVSAILKTEGVIEEFQNSSSNN